MWLDTIKFWWAESAKIPLLLGLGFVFASVIALLVFYNSPHGTISAKVTGVFYQNKNKPSSMISVRLNNGSLDSIGPINHRVVVGEALCLQVGENVFGLKQHRFLHVGNCK